MGRRVRAEVGPPGKLREGPADLTASLFRVGDEEFALLAFPLPRLELPMALAEKLSGAERDIAAAVLQGLGAGDIARLRKRSRFTIANQLSSLFRKLGVSSVRELVSLCACEAAQEAMQANHPPGSETGDPETKVSRWQGST